MNNIEALVTVSIASHGDARKIKELLKSIVQYENKKLFKIIIVDNLGGGDLVEDIFGNTLILRNSTPKGFAHNHNKAFQYSTGEYFCVLNPDIVFTELVFEHLIASLENHQADIISPLVVDSKGNIQDSFRDLPTPSEILSRRLVKKPPVLMPSEPLSPDWLAGMFLFMKTDTFRKLGGFDEGYHLYFEDVDFCTRARLEGFRIVLDPSLRVRHDAHRASEKKLRYLYWHLQSAMRFFSSQVYSDAKKKRG
ncbi:MAG: glycosyltransferase [Chloroflexi bacterium]|nr:glycosyltransferase [Chloroflexota bacterium]